MSEVVYATIASFGLLAGVWAIRGLRASQTAHRVLAGSDTMPYVPLVLGGLLLGSAWFIRASATAPIAAVALVIAGLNVAFPSRLAKACACFLGPVAAFVVAECAVNQRFCGEFRPGTGTLKVDGKVVATQTMPKTLPISLQWDESFDIGSDTLTGVNDEDYKPPFTLTAKLNKLTIKIDRPRLSPADIQKLEAAQRNNKASE